MSHLFSFKQHIKMVYASKDPLINKTKLMKYNLVVPWDCESEQTSAKSISALYLLKNKLVSNYPLKMRQIPLSWFGQTTN